MAKEAPKKDAEAGAAQPRSMKKLIIIIVALVLVLVIGAVVAVVMINKSKHKAEGGQEQAAAEETHESPKFDPKKPPVFVPLEPFTVNLLQGDTGEQFLQVVATLRVSDEKMGEEVKVFMPQIRHEILTLLAGKHAADITSPDGRTALADEIRETVNEVLGWEPPKKTKKGAKEDTGPIIAVFFTQFIVQ